MEYTVREVAEMFGEKSVDISAIIAKGGIKGVRTAPSDFGVEYVINDQGVDMIGAVLGKAIKKAENESIEEDVYQGVSKALQMVIDSGMLKDALLEVFDSDAIESRVNRAVYSALNGIRKQSEREERDIVPQKWNR